MHISRAAPILTVTDLRSAVDSYLAVFDCQVLMDHGWIVTLGSPDGPQFSLMESDLTAPVNPVASIQVDDVDATHEAVARAGLAVIHPPSDEEWGVRRFFFADPAGNVINVLGHR